MPTSLYSLLPEEMDNIVVGLGYPRYRADQLLHSLYHDFPVSISDLHQIPSSMKQSLVDAGYTLDECNQTQLVSSEDKDTTKILLEFDKQTQIETVLMQYGNSPDKHSRSTVCVSTQVGCPMGCKFCATGDMGFFKNLKTEQIVLQVLYFAKILKEKSEHITNLVFMGMGEPLANYDQTLKAIRLLTHPRAFGLGQRNITLSTVGIISGIQRLADEDLQIKLAISLHAPNNVIRKKLIPTASSDSVQELMQAAKNYFKKTGRRVTFEYALVKDVNDSNAVAKELAVLLKGNGAHVNLIPMNPTAGGLERPERKRVLAFQQILKDSNVNCTVRVEKGVEIAAACGQLKIESMRAPMSPTKSGKL